jgi:hypothetical protein
MESKDPLILALDAELGERSPSVQLPMIGPEFVAYLEDPEHRLDFCRILIRVGGFVEVAQFRTCSYTSRHIQQTSFTPIHEVGFIRWAFS